MIRIIDGRGTGKTRKLMMTAEANKGVIVCSHPQAMMEKAHYYGVTGVEFISYVDYVNKLYDVYKDVYIDEIELFVRFLGGNLSGYTLSVD